jgi:hypothetical protein
LALENSILKSIRQRIGPSADYDAFDTDLITLINSAFSRLCQLGVGPTEPFRVSDDKATWDEFMDDGPLEDVKDYVYLSVKLTFDPPTNGNVLSAYQEKIKQYEYILRDFEHYGY